MTYVFRGGGDVFGDAATAVQLTAADLYPNEKFAVDRYAVSTANGISYDDAAAAISAYMNANSGLQLEKYNPRSPTVIPNWVLEILAKRAASRQTTASILKSYADEGVLTPELANFVQASAFDPNTHLSLKPGDVDASTGHVMSAADLALSQPTQATPAAPSTGPSASANYPAATASKGPSDTLRVDGPTGDDTDTPRSRTKVLLIAAGVGIGVLGLAAALSHKRR